MANSYSLSFNEAKKTWIARVKDKDNSSWKTKWLPKSFLRTQALDAERYLITWYAAYLNGSEKIEKPAPLTIALLAERWLELRYNDTSTKPNTYHGLAQSMRNWILTNDRFIHTKIDHLDLPTEMTVEVLRNWISSLGCSRSSKLAHIMALRSFIRDSLAEGWLPENMINPLDKPALQRIQRQISKARRETHTVNTLSAEQARGLLSARHVPDFRKLRYLTALCTGLRDHEVQGLIWSDLDFSGMVVHVQRQLDKIGCLPAMTYEDLVEQGQSKADIKALPNAIVANPKRNSKRAVPMHPQLAAALTWWHDVGYKKHVLKSPLPHMPVFGASSHHAKRTYPGKAAGSLGDFCHPDSAMCIKADLARLPHSASDMPTSNFHALRHTFASWLEASGASREHIGDLLGHGASMTSAHYIQKKIETYAKLLNQLTIPPIVLADGAIF